MTGRPPVEITPDHLEFLDRVRRNETDPTTVAVWGINGQIDDCIRAGLVVQPYPDRAVYRLTDAGRTALGGSLG